MLEERDQAYVLAVRSNHTLRFLEEWSLVQTDLRTMIAELPDAAWTPLSAGEGAKETRLNHWARVPLKSQAEQARIFPLAARAEKPARSRRDCLSLHLRLL